MRLVLPSQELKLRLSPDQFHGLAGRLKAPDGGFSVHMPTGHEPGSGYMVAQAGYERSYPKGHDVTPGELQGYTAEHAVKMAPKQNYFGGWHDPDTGQKYLDVSENHQDFVRGVAGTHVEDQRSMYDLNRDRSVSNVSKVGAPSLGIVPDSPKEQASMAKTSRDYLTNAPAEPPEFLKTRDRH
jgi:hypothetical protein